MSLTPGPAGATDDAPSETDRLLAALADADRRAVVRTLAASGPASVEALAARVADDPGDRQRLRVALVHRHLPTLAGAGVVTYDEATGRVALDADERALALLRAASP